MKEKVRKSLRWQFSSEGIGLDIGETAFVWFRRAKPFISLEKVKAEK